MVVSEARQGLQSMLIERIVVQSYASAPIASRLDGGQGLLPLLS